MSSFAAPGSNPRGVVFCSAWYDFWLVVDGPSPYVYKANTYNGSISASFAAPGGPGAWGVSRGSDYYHLYVSNFATSYIYDVTTAGSLVGSFHCALPGPTDMDYITGLYAAFPNQNLIARIDTTTGSIISTYAGPATRVTACCWGPLYAADSAAHAIYQSGYPIISGIQTPVGLDGVFLADSPNYLIISDDATDKVYEYGDSVTVEPSSFGRVKAVYR
jgi:hypothetical protein